MKLQKANIGDPFEYKEEKYLLKGIDFENGLYKIDTDKERLFISESGIDEINFIKMEQSNKYLEKPVDTPSTVINTNAGQLTDILMENINKLQSDPAFVPQAEAINQQVKTIIDIAKAQIEMYKAMRG